MDKENPKKDGDEEGETKSFKDPAIISAISGGITAELPPDSLIEHRYTKDELLKLRKAPLAQKKPTCLDSAYYNAAGIWDPEPWHYSNKQAELAQAHENGSQGGGGGGGGGDEAPIPGGKQRSRPSDPRERLRKEQDGIVLSPQRRSFNSGCFVPGREASTAITAPGVPGVAPLPLRGNRAHSPLGGVGVGVGKAGEREQPMQRRIGSGRILPWDYQEKTEENDFGYRSRDRDERGGGGRGDDRDRERGERGDRRRERTADHPEDRFERRSFGRDFESSKEVKHRQPGRFNRRVSNESREEEPEWFSSGPISQNDTIELRGFDDPPEKSLNLKKKGKRVNGDSATTTSSSGKSKEIKKLASKESLIGKDGRSSPEKNGEKGEKSGDKKKDAAPVAEEEKKGAAGDMQEECFNFDAMFKADSLQIPGLLSNGIESGDSAGSRFSRWFQRERSPPTTTAQQLNESKRTSPQQEQPHHNLIRNLLGDSFNEATVAIPQPGDAESYFAPISPAANTLPTLHNKQHPHQQQSSLNLIEMQQRAAAAAAAAAVAGGVSAGKKESAGGGGGGAPGSGKILSLEELEAPLRQGAPDKAAQSKASEEDKQQFNRLFSQMNTNGPMMQQQAPQQQQQQQQSKPMSIMEMLSHSQQKDAEVHHHQQHHPRMHQRVGGSSSGVSGGGAGPPLQNMSEMAYKLQQVQNQVQRQQQLDMLSKLFAAGSFNAHQRTSPLQEMGMAQSRDLLNRPEAQAIMQGLKRGDITPQHLYQQLANPAMQPRHREMLVTILKMQPLPTQAPPSQPQAQQTQPQPPPAMVVAPQTAPPPPQQQQAQPGVGVVPPAAVSPNFYTQQLRVSPLTPNAYCVSPIMATSPNTLSVPALHQRIPSPRELQVHTQNIMQRALIKKKLEEQEENYRKKQQQAQQHQSRGAAGSPAKSTASPTLAFTPTSVMRKMNADKDDSKDGKDKIPQGRPLTGHRSAPQQSNPPVNLQQQQQQQQQQTWNHFTAQMKQPGRAIVKANNYQPGGQNAAEFFAQQQQAQQHRLMHQQQHLPQQQSQQQPQAPKNYYNQQQHQMSTGPTSGGHGTGQQYQQLSQQQLRQQHQNVRAQHQHQQQQPQAQPPQQAAQPQTFQHPPAGSWMGGSAQQAASFDANHHRGDLSPTSDQLARWFSPDLLDRARKGNVPSISNAVAQHALSLEEIERQTTTIGQH